MYSTSDEREKKVLKDAGVPLVGLVYGKLLVDKASAEKYEIILEFAIDEAEAGKLLGKAGKALIEIPVEAPVECIGFTKSGERCKRKATHGKFCAAHKGE